MRERDVRLAVQSALVSTSAFSYVTLDGLPENYGFGTSEETAAVIEPVRTAMKMGWDAQTGGSLSYSSSLSITLFARHPDPQLRDELAEQLLEYLKNAVNGQVIMPGYMVPGKSLVTSWEWIAAMPPERRIKAVITYEYIELGWNAGDTSQ